MTHHATTNHRPVTITSESVSEGHPDKVCDYIADSILDAYLAEDPHSRVACEVLCKCNLVVVAGEVSSLARIDYERVVREAIGQIGYTDPAESFSAESVQILLAMTRQSAEIGRAVDGADAGSPENQGAGDQGIMFGYATDETPELMPLPIVLAHALTKGLADDRRARVVDWLRPDAKAQVSVVYDNGRPRAVRKPGRSRIQRIAVYDVGGELSPCKASVQLTSTMRHFGTEAHLSQAFAHGSAVAAARLLSPSLFRLDQSTAAGRH